MLKKLNCRAKMQTIRFFTFSFVAFVFLTLSTNCNNPSKDAKEENKASNSGSDTAALVNWLDIHPGWDTVAFKSAPDDIKSIEEEKRRIRIYVRGCLAEYNADHSGANYVVDSFDFAQKSSSPLRYTVQAFLFPPAKLAHGHDDHHGPGAHLVPPEPDPPGGSQ